MGPGLGKTVGAPKNFRISAGLFLKVHQFVVQEDPMPLTPSTAEFARLDPSSVARPCRLARRCCAAVGGAGFLLAAVLLWAVPMPNAAQDLALMKLGLSLGLTGGGLAALGWARERRRV